MESCHVAAKAPFLPPIVKCEFLRVKGATGRSSSLLRATWQGSGRGGQSPVGTLSTLPSYSPFSFLTAKAGNLFILKKTQLLGTARAFPHQSIYFQESHGD